MPRDKKPARLWLRPERTKDGKTVSAATWLILDGGKQIGTGADALSIGFAHSQLEKHLAQKRVQKVRGKILEEIKISDVIKLYAQDIVPNLAAPAKVSSALKRIVIFYGNKSLSEVNGASCREYSAKRGNVGGSRWDLEHFRAAINYHQAEGYHRETVNVTLPSKLPARERWLTESEVAKLIWVCWKTREIQTIHRGENKGKRIETNRFPLRHIARFIIFAIYTGSRSGAILTASYHKGEGRSFIDLEHKLFYRLAIGKKETNKRQPPVPLSGRLEAHLRRWLEKGHCASFAVEWEGAPVSSIKTGFATAVKKAGLEGDITPHTLRHTAATWLMQRKTEVWDAAGYLGMSPQMVQQVYGHHHPDFLRGTADILSRKPTNDIPTIRKNKS